MAAFNPKDLAQTSYTAKYQETLKTKSGAMAMSSVVYFKYAPGAVKMKFSSTVSPPQGAPPAGMPQMSSDIIIIAKVGQNGEIISMDKALVSSATPMGNIIMDMTSNFSKDKYPKAYQMADSRHILKDAQIEQLGTKDIAGVKANRLKLTIQGKESIVSYHPKYAIMLETENDTVSMIATELKIGDISDSEFEPKGGQSINLDFSKLAGMFGKPGAMPGQPGSITPPAKPGAIAPSGTAPGSGQQPSFDLGKFTEVFGALGASAAASKAVCTKCGKPTGGGKFCNNCGAPVTPVAYCPKCGAKNAPGVNFCGSCGNKLD